MATIVSEIEFENNPFKVCYSGQLLKGVARIIFPYSTHVRGISIKFVGVGFCRWVDEMSGDERIGSKKYFDARIDLVDNSEDDIVSAGNNEYAFNIRLPTNLPTSYEGTHGHIRYMMALYIDRSFHSQEPLIETFTIIKPLNLNSGNAYKMPMEVLKFARFTRFFLFCHEWKSGDLRIYGRLPVSGYCSGQVINLNLEVINHSGQDIIKFVVRFIKEVTYNSNDGMKKTETITLAEQKTEGIRGNRTSIQTIKVNITIPTLPPTGFQSTNHICVLNYMLKVTAVTRFRNQDPLLEIPVIIGTYPISDELHQFTIDSSSSEYTEPLFARLHFNNDTLNELPPYPDTDPPTYEDAIRNETSTGKTKFTPKYPVYRRETSYSIDSFE